MLAAPKIKTARATRSYQRSPGYVSISTIDDLGKHYTDEEREKYKHQLEVLGRKSFKNLKGLSEAVWAPQMEAALLQGLERYNAYISAKEAATKYKGNPHRGRNTFISSFIFQKTNQHRTTKQIGSRLQQLKSSTKDHRIKGLIMGSPVPEVELEPLMSTRPLALATSPNFTADRPIRLPIRILPQSARYPSPTPELVLGSPPQSIQLRTLPEWKTSTRIIRGMDPVVTLISHYPLKAHSFFEMHFGGKLRWTSTASLNPVGTSEGTWHYDTSIAGNLWDKFKFCESLQYVECTVTQSVFRSDGETPAQDVPFAEIVYTFEPDQTRPDLDTLIQRYNERTARKVAALPRDRFRHVFFRPADMPEGCTRAPSSKLPVDVHSDSGRSTQFNSIPMPNISRQVTQHTLPTSFLECKKNERAESSCMVRRTIASSSFSSLAGWDKFDLKPVEVYRNNELLTLPTTTVHPPQASFDNSPQVYSTTGYYDVDSRSEQHNYYYASDSAVVGGQTHFMVNLNIGQPQHKAKPQAAYSITGEYMGCYPVHDY
ncbi:hypothetical protein B0H10DRAFT_762027 [Mycena sp. CBHHK59/15]|nr:hypothetical protein B0H10DRAFT_762027 [Mycena sp. CBHHK59/15]